jgi:hypothetical protein
MTVVIVVGLRAMRQVSEVLKDIASMGLRCAKVREEAFKIL